MRLAVLTAIALLVASSAGDAQTFDAASIRPFDPNTPQPYPITGGPGTNDPSRFSAARVGLSYLLTRAFDISTDQISGPDWLLDLSANNYTIVATMPPDTTKEQFEKMLQNLLAERFHLVFHRETREFPGYALVVDKGGPKFKEVASTAPADAPPDTRSVTTLGGGAGAIPALPPGPRTFSTSRAGDVRTTYQERTMAEFISNLGFLIGSSQGRSVTDGYAQPRVIDRTGLTGRYTFTLEYYNEGVAALARRFAATGPPNASTGQPNLTDPPGSSLPNIFTAIQDQLGLRLEKIPNVPLDMIVIDSLDKVPTPN